MHEILEAVKKSEFTREIYLTINNIRTKVTFIGTTHDEQVYYYFDNEMILKSFKHWTALYDHTFFYICKGFIAGLIACNNGKIDY